MGTALVMAMVAATAPAPSGETLFQRCFACHSVDPAEQGLPGPNLAGVVGRRAASLKGFDYSPAMRAAGERGLAWTEAELDRFLTDAQAAVPQTSMFTPPLRDPAHRAALIAYLKDHR